MKDKQGKHDHKLTKLLKFGLFATLMVAPLFAVLFKCMYVTFNKNAYQSYYGETINQFTEITPSTYENGENYRLNIQTNDLVSSTITINLYSNIENIAHPNLSTTNINNIEENCTSFQFKNNSTNNMYISFLDTNNSVITNVNVKADYIRFDFVSDSYTGPIDEIKQFIKEREYNKESFLDNAFYYSIDEMQNNSLFNWTTSTAIYTPINAMTSGLGITTDAVSILLTYWLYLTLIYIVIDIVVELFTWMTHTLLGKPLG